MWRLLQPTSTQNHLLNMQCQPLLVVVVPCHRYRHTSLGWVFQPQCTSPADQTVPICLHHLRLKPSYRWWNSYQFSRSLTESWSHGSKTLWSYHQAAACTSQGGPRQIYTLWNATGLHKAETRRWDIQSPGIGSGIRESVASQTSMGSILKQSHPLDARVCTHMMGQLIGWDLGIPGML